MRRNSPWIALVVLLISACESPPPSSLSREQRKVLDSLVRIENRAATVRIDSQCTARREALIDHLTDSLLQAELRAIKRIQG